MSVAWSVRTLGFDSKYDTEVFVDKILRVSCAFVFVVLDYGCSLFVHLLSRSVV